MSREEPTLWTVKRSGKRLAAGVYEYRGAVHIDSDEFLEHHGFRPTGPNVSALLSGFQRVASELEMPYSVAEEHRVRSPEPLQ